MPPTRRIAVVGTSGSGKTTLSRRIGAALDLPVVELDAINWQADWRDLNSDDPDLFASRVSEAIAPDCWVCDGNYGLVRPMILARATDLVWLDYSKARVMRQVVRRSLVRAIWRDELWPGTGNVEHFSRWLDSGHPIRWAWSTYADRKRRYAELVNSQPASVTVHHLRRPRQADALLGALASRTMLQARGNGRRLMEAPRLRWRLAGPADARALCHLGRATFLATFAVDHPGGALLDFLDSAHDIDQYRAWLDDPAYTIFIGETPLGAPAGYAMLTPPAHPHLSRQGDIELKRIYLLAPWQGSGEADRLVGLAIDAARARGADRLILAVYEINGRARRFYERHGFVHIGETTFMVGDVEFPDLVYARRLT